MRLSQKLKTVGFMKRWVVATEKGFNQSRMAGTVVENGQLWSKMGASNQKWFKMPSNRC